MPPLAPLTLRGVHWDWSRPYVLGVVNVTPDSFSDGGRFADAARAIEHGLALVDEGADALDIGGESTRPGADPVSSEEELARVIPVIEGLAARTAVPLSIDTTKCAVARAALAAGASIVNDVGVGESLESLGAVAAEAGAAYLAMHARGTPATMRTLTQYDDVVCEVTDDLARRAETLVRVGVAPTHVMLDPGIGFAKTAAQSLALLANLAPLCALGYPVCVGPSRKRYVDDASAFAPSWNVHPTAPTERVGSTAAAVTLSVMQGAAIVRVHDVAVMRQAARVAHACRLARGAP